MQLTDAPQQCNTSHNNFGVVDQTQFSMLYNTNFKLVCSSPMNYGSLIPSALIYVWILPQLLGNKYVSVGTPSLYSPTLTCTRKVPECRFIQLYVIKSVINLISVLNISLPRCRWCLVLTQWYNIPEQQLCDPGGNWRRNWYCPALHD